MIDLARTGLGYSVLDWSCKFRIYRDSHVIDPRNGQCLIKQAITRNYLVSIFRYILKMLKQGFRIPHI